MAQSHHHKDMVGNRDGKDMQGWTFPLPDDDSWSCDGTEESDRGTPFALNTSFAQEHFVNSAPRWPCFAGSTASTIGNGAGVLSFSTNDQEWLRASNHTKWDCRAASGSGRTQFLDDCNSVGENTQDVQNQHAHGQPSLHHRGTQSVAGEQQHIETFPQSQPNPLLQPPTACAPAHGPCLKLTGGAPDQPSSTWDTDSHPNSMSTQYYASTTDLLLQNLSMVVGNPSARCYANAPWRAFCWMCAYLAEFNRDPWGVIKEAVQTSLELSEPVDIQQLPGLHELWQKHDLNVEGDAAHFVHSLWLHSQTRVMQYRHTEIKEGGYVKEHTQLPLIVDYPDEYLDEITWQELMNCGRTTVMVSTSAMTNSSMSATSTEQSPLRAPSQNTNGPSTPTDHTPSPDP